MACPTCNDKGVVPTKYAFGMTGPHAIPRDATCPTCKGRTVAPPEPVASPQPATTLPDDGKQWIRDYYVERFGSEASTN